MRKRRGVIGDVDLEIAQLQASIKKNRDALRKALARRQQALRNNPLCQFPTLGPGCGYDFADDLECRLPDWVRRWLIIEVAKSIPRYYYPGACTKVSICEQNGVPLCYNHSRTAKRFSQDRDLTPEKREKCVTEARGRFRALYANAVELHAAGWIGGLHQLGDPERGLWFRSIAIAHAQYLASNTGSSPESGKSETSA